MLPPLRPQPSLPRFPLLPPFPFGGFLVKTPPLDLFEHALALEHALERLDRLFDIAVANFYVHRAYLFSSWFALIIRLSFVSRRLV